ncbi:MAG: hypothetical protein GW790_11295 [Rhodoferax sp.]|nr:hypothetical protein [Rhodoferax sp.]
MSAAAVMQRAAATGVRLKLVDGKVKALGKRAAVEQLLEELREWKAEIVVVLDSVDAPARETINVLPQLGTIRPPGLSPKLLTASVALDAWIESQRSS